MDDDLAVAIMERTLVSNRMLLSVSLCLKALPFNNDAELDDLLWILRKCVVCSVITYNFDPKLHDTLMARARHCAMNDPREQSEKSIADTQSQLCLSYLLGNERSADFVVSQEATFKKGLSALSGISHVGSEWRRTMLSLDTVFSDELQAAVERAVEFEEEFWSAPIWPDSARNSFLVGQIQAFMDQLRSMGDGKFWWGWYNDLLRKEPLDWDFLAEVALIEDDVWLAGPKAVAEAIREIEAQRAGEPLDQDTLKRHAAQIVASHVLHADFAQSLSVQMSSAVTAYKAEAQTNSLPDGFAQYERLPSAFEKLSRLLQSDRAPDEKIAALVAEVNRLHATNLQLRQDLSDARLALSSARLDKVEAAQTRTFGEKAQTFLTNVTLVGAMGMGMFHFFGIEESELKYDVLKQQLDELTREMQNVQPVLAADTAP